MKTKSQEKTIGINELPMMRAFVGLRREADRWHNRLWRAISHRARAAHRREYEQLKRAAFAEMRQHIAEVLAE